MKYELRLTTAALTTAPGLRPGLTTGAPAALLTTGPPVVSLTAASLTVVPNSRRENINGLTFW